MTTLDDLVQRAHKAGASDLHLEPGLPAGVRVRGRLELSGEPLSSAEILQMARAVASADQWSAFLTQRSMDLSRTIGGVRCRINALHSSRGVGLAVRLLTAFRATVESLNLHPSLRDLVGYRHGLILVSGPTGSGKSSTIAALVQEINRAETRHVIMIEAPVEYAIVPQRSFIRQREVGRDTPSFDQALVDSLREDPDVIVVGEMRHPETMRLVLGAAETGHLVLTTVHSSTVAEALHRIVSAFPAEARAGVSAQLADCLLAVICQDLVFRPDLGIRVPECEILRTSEGVRSMVRSQALHRLQLAMETGGAEEMWSRDRYRRWLSSRDQFVVPRAGEVEALPPEPEPAPRAVAPPRPAPRRPPPADNVLDLDADGAEDLAAILEELGQSAPMLLVLLAVGCAGGSGAVRQGHPGVPADTAPAPDTAPPADTADTAAPCPDGMVLVQAATTFCMDRYEAPGRAGALPLVMYTFIEARAWCEARGRRLCLDSEWQAACEGAQGWAYPYGDTQEPGRCNDEETWLTYDQDQLNLWPSTASSAEVESLDELLAAAGAAADHVAWLYQGEGSGDNAGCVGEHAVYDLTGNVEEWTEREDGGATDFHGALKGRYWAETRTCQSRITAHGDSFRFYEIGFRCCADPG